MLIVQTSLKDMSSVLQLLYKSQFLCGAWSLALYFKLLLLLPAFDLMAFLVFSIIQCTPVACRCNTFHLELHPFFPIPVFLAADSL